MNCLSGQTPELTLSRVLEVFLAEYLQGRSVPAHHLKVLRRLGRCRSPLLGWTVWLCQQCHRSHWRPNGCGDRHCPSCQHQLSHQWLERQRQALLPVRYFHWVFTLPAKLRPLALQNPQALYGLLFESASATLLQFGQQWFGAELGITAILHTWGQNLMDHPHLHCLVTGGGLTAQNSWAGPKQARWLFPIHAIGQVFRVRFCAGLLQLHTTGQLQFHGALQPLSQAGAFTQLLCQLQAQRWVVFATGGQADTGRTPWERRLIERLRLNHYAWRTEQTYREWAWRLDGFVGRRGAEGATAEDVKGFLSELVVKGRVSVSTQKQALNALVFLFREALGRDLGGLRGYEVSRRGARVPTVLSRQECQRLFEKLEGTPRLMAQLMYASGLRLTELLRLRIKDVDLERQQLFVRAGKGDKDRVTGNIGVKSCLLDNWVCLGPWRTPCQSQRHPRSSPG